MSDIPPPVKKMLKISSDVKPGIGITVGYADTKKDYWTELPKFTTLREIARHHALLKKFTMHIICSIFISYFTYYAK